MTGEDLISPRVAKTRRSTPVGCVDCIQGTREVANEDEVGSDHAA